MVGWFKDSTCAKDIYIIYIFINALYGAKDERTWPSNAHHSIIKYAPCCDTRALHHRAIVFWMRENFGCKNAKLIFGLRVCKIVCRPRPALASHHRTRALRVWRRSNAGGRRISFLPCALVMIKSGAWAVFGCGIYGTKDQRNFLWECVFYEKNLIICF